MDWFQFVVIASIGSWNWETFSLYSCQLYSRCSVFVEYMFKEEAT